MDLIPSDIRLIAIAVVVVVLVAVVAWEYTRRRAATLRKKIGSE
jgi:sensor domain CHASE-containing protein